MNWADWTIIAILLISCLIGIKRGLIKEALSVALWIAAFFVAMTFREQMATLLNESITTPSVREVTAFLILFVATLIVGALVNYLLGELVKATGLSGTDRLLGMIFGAARGGIIVLALVVFLPQLIPVDQDPWWQESVMIPSFLSMEGWARETTAVLVDYVTSLF